MHGKADPPFHAGEAVPGGAFAFAEDAPLFSALSRHAAKGRASFHTPGHKGHAGVLRPLGLLSHDLTELPDTASLYDGGGALEESERLAARAFGAGATLFGAGGCTLAIQTMLLLGAGAGSSVVMARGSHRSAVHAAALLDLRPVWVWPDNAAGVVTPSGVARALEQSPDARAVYLTSPDYYGRLCDIAAVAALCRARGIPLLVDNAHGSHLGAFGRHPLALGAAMSADSAHKTLPVLTGGAFLHLSRAFAPPARRDALRASAKAAMSLFGSTSPSFPVLASLDLARAWWERAGTAAFQGVAEEVSRLRGQAGKRGLLPAFPCETDPARFTLDAGALDADGREVADFFRAGGCEPEYADARYIVFIPTPFNTPAELRRLEGALASLPAEQRRGRFLRRRGEPPAAPSLALSADDAPQAVMTPREALLAPFETVPVSKAAGRISVRAVCPCPPGVAAVMPGEVLAAGTVERLESAGFGCLDVALSV